MIKCASQRVNVAPRVGRSAVSGLFRRDVINRSDHVTGSGHAEFIAAQITRQSQIRQLEDGPAVLVADEKVRRLDIPVDDLLIVKVSQRSNGLRDQPAGFIFLEIAYAADVLVQIDARHVI